MENFSLQIQCDFWSVLSEAVSESFWDSAAFASNFSHMTLKPTKKNLAHKKPIKIPHGNKKIYQLEWHKKFSYCAHCIFSIQLTSKNIFFVSYSVTKWTFFLSPSTRSHSQHQRNDNKRKSLPIALFPIPDKSSLVFFSRLRGAMLSSHSSELIFSHECNYIWICSKA